jgi:hypothetical protein
VLLVVLGAGLLTRIIDHAEVPPKKPASVPLEIRTVEGQPVTETVDNAKFLAQSGLVNDSSRCSRNRNTPSRTGRTPSAILPCRTARVSVA